MTIDLEDTLRTALRQHTAGVQADPGLVGAVLHGGARRRLHGRLALAAVPVLVIAAVVGGAALAPRLGPGGRGQDTLPAADGALLARSTQGDLADDGSYLQAVALAWSTNYRTSQNADRGIFDHLLGRPKVLWAGTTPVGPAAVVAQSADLRPHAGIQLDHPGPALVWGFVSADPAGSARVVSDGYPVEGAPSTEAAFIGPHRNVILVLDRGHPVDMSFRRTYADDGHTGRDWQPVRFPDSGVAIVTVPVSTPPGAVVLRGGSAGRIAVGNAYDPSAAPRSEGGTDPRLQWSGPSGDRPVWLVGSDPTAAWQGTAPDAAAAQLALTDGLAGRLAELERDPTLLALGESLWFAVGSTPDGSRLVVGDMTVDFDPSRVYAVLRSPTGRVDVAARWSDVDGPLPVAVPLPRGQGWVVARKGAQLSYRTATGSWQPAGPNAALLPAGATAVRVVHNGHSSEVQLYR